MSLELQLLMEDALANHFTIGIPTFPGMDDLVNTNLRVLTVDIPDKQIGTYQVTYGGRSATRPSGLVETPNEFSFTYRVDKYMKVYKGFMAWTELIQSSSTALGLGDAIPLTGGISPIRVPITVETAEANKVPNGTQWVFNGCFPSGHGAITFDENSGDPIEATVTMQFIDCVYPVI